MNIRTLNQIKFLCEQTLSDPSFSLVSRAIAVLNLTVDITIKEFSVKEISAYASHFPENRRRIPVVCSKEASLSRLERYNKKSLESQTEDKAVFYEICNRNDIDIPKFYFCAELSDSRFVEFRDKCINHPDDAAEYLGNEFITKDKDGAYGSGFHTFKRDGRKFIVDNKSILDIEEIPQYLIDLEGKSPVIVQERVYDHSTLNDFSGSSALQCARLVTHRSESGSVRLVYFMIKIILGSNILDNFSGGMSGNMIAYGDPETGQLKAAVRRRDGRLGLEEIHHHPETGAAFADLLLPNWSDAKALAFRAHGAFPGLDVIGWDIALTERGPLVLEGNAWWDPPLYQPELMTADDWKLFFG